MELSLPPDPYAALGVRKDASHSEIKSAYRKLVLRCHPDKFCEESVKAQKQEEFINVQQAYEIIGDDERRERYDAEVKLELLRKERVKQTTSEQTTPRTPAPQPYLYQSIPRRRYEERVTQTTAQSNRRRRNRNTMEGLEGMLNGKVVTALCDTGADENFIAEDHAISLCLVILELDGPERPTFVMGHGRHINAIGRIKASWCFSDQVSGPDTIFYVLRDCIFDLMVGSKYLSLTDTMTNNRHRLCRIPKPQRAVGARLVNICGTPSRRVMGFLRGEDRTYESCAALPDSGAEPNLLSYEYVERRGWLLDMFRGPESCQLLQFADGSTEKVSGRLRLRWVFGKRKRVTETDYRGSVVFDVLRGCPFDVILGSDLLDDCEAFTRYRHCFEDVIHEGPSGLNLVIWAPFKKKKKDKEQDKLRSKEDEMDRSLEILRDRRLKEKRPELHTARSPQEPSHKNYGSWTPSTTTNMRDLPIRIPRRSIDAMHPNALSKIRGGTMADRTGAGQALRDSVH